MQTASETAPPSLMTEARAYWERYLWHHRDPLTRRLHRVGSLVVLAGIGATLAGAGWVWLPLCTAIGYGFAFAGHWFVEKNRPLTFENPLRAGIANWVMFVYELFWDVEAELRRIAENPPDTADMGNQ